MSEFFILTASSTNIPSRISVAYELLAIAEPHPNVLKTALSILPVFSFTYIYSFITSPHAGAPTRPVPTFGSFLFSEPTFLGFS